MMRRAISAVVTVGLLAGAAPLQAWNDRGHMTVAYIAYQLLEKNTVRPRVDALLKKNPEYARWVQNAPAGQEGLIAFLNASVWADCIKGFGGSCPGYISDGPDGGNTPPDTPEAGQNIGYSDRFMHKYWHFIDHAFTQAGLPTIPPPTINAVTQIRLFRDAIRGPASDDVKSYDIVWLAHIVGDLHQPLHAIQRFTRNTPKGDAGGNLVRFCNDCPQPNNLHSIWDGALGDDSSMASVKSLGDELLQTPSPPGAASMDVMAWSLDSAKLARQHVYKKPISLDNNPNQKLSPPPDAAYRSNALKVARRQVRLAGQRLANLLNGNLK